ncbi:hypothetical protein AVEN_128912-1 [Araneus ventricosus]|uniref:Uncharacterized protein n=1 Tax=Araneus ventricosus TaxID=182803 RepID=A0A4Y2UQK8_ARAVE|nr:hypothetical protein AVEN_128912-1 [Araneus ventricosus]
MEEFRLQYQGVAHPRADSTKNSIVSTNLVLVKSFASSRSEIWKFGNEVPSGLSPFSAQMVRRFKLMLTTIQTDKVRLRISSYLLKGTLIIFNLTERNHREMESV